MSDKVKLIERRGGLDGKFSLAHQCALLTVAFVVTVSSSVVLHAGSIFMKNGYIIQGRIVDRDTEGVILGWPNGKVSIAHRFVEEVVYEPGEEERILFLEKAREEGENSADDITILDLDATTEVPELPARLEILRNRLRVSVPNRNLDMSDDPPVEDDPFGSDPEFTSDGTPDVDAVVRELSLGEAVANGAIGISVRPPKGWQDKSHGEVLAFVAAPGVDGFAPSFNVVSMPRGPLSMTEFTEILKADQEEKIDSFELLSEGPTSVGGQQAYETVARGEWRGQVAVFRQIVLVGESRVWLFSMFTADETDMDPDSTSDADQAMAIMEEALESVEFINGDGVDFEVDEQDEAFDEQDLDRDGSESVDESTDSSEL